MNVQKQNKVALITGAGSGIGRAIATRFAAAGARVCIWDIVEEAAADAAAEIDGANRSIETTVVDVADHAGPGVPAGDVAVAPTGPVGPGESQSCQRSSAAIRNPKNNPPLPPRRERSLNGIRRNPGGTLHLS